MGNVAWSEAMSYGITMVGYFAFVCFLGGLSIFTGIAAIAENENRMLGSILFFLGSSVLMAGYFGAMYKIIADGVGRGNGHISSPQTINEQILIKLQEQSNDGTETSESISND